MITNEKIHCTTLKHPTHRSNEYFSYLSLCQLTFFSMFFYQIFSFFNMCFHFSGALTPEATEATVQYAKDKGNTGVLISTMIIKMEKKLKTKVFLKACFIVCQLLYMF